MSKILNRIFFNKFKVKKLITTTDFSSIYEGINEKENEPVAMKFERKGGRYNFLESEAYFLFNLKGFGIPKIITFGKCGIYNILIEELLGPSINSIFELKKHKFLIKDICMLGIQILDRLEFIHSKDVIHRDIKPLNFIIGRKDPKNIYIIDFSFAHKYRSSRTGKHIQFKNTGLLLGSLKYLSINANY